MLEHLKFYLLYLKHPGRAAFLIPDLPHGFSICKVLVKVFPLKKHFMSVQTPSG